MVGIASFCAVRAHSSHSGLIGLLLAVAVSACFGPSNIQAAQATDAPAKPLPVVVSIAPQKYMVEKIAGETVSVTVLVQPGADPHSFEPGPSQMRGISKAAVYFTIGVPFEDTWLPRLKGVTTMTEKASSGPRIVSVIRDIQRLKALPHNEEEKEEHSADHHEAGSDHAEVGHEHVGAGDDHNAGGHAHGEMEKAHAGASAHNNAGHGHGHNHDGEDPHIWLAPLQIKAMLPVIAETLCDLLPARAEQFRAAEKRFAEELDSLHNEIAADFAPIPEAQRVFLTFHPSWQYFSREFKLKELSIEVEGKEPGPKELKAVIDIARRYDLRVLFIEPQFPKAAAKAAAQNIGARVEEIDPLTEDVQAGLRRTAKQLRDSFTR